ncbi:MAG: DUF3613 domain-containing protein [Solimonas sp.]
MKKLIIAAAALLVSAPLFAQQAGDTPAGTPEAQASPLPRIGGDTLTWLELQKSPSAQVTDVRPVPGEVAEQVYQRYVNSFKFPIPAEFKRDNFVQGGGGS